MANMAYYNSFTDLISNPTVFIFGAGASADYGMPLWKGLKKDLLEIFADKTHENLLGAENQRELYSKIQQLKCDKTIDQLATEFNTDLNDSYIKAMALVFVQREAADLKKGNSAWIEIFLDKLVPVIEESAANNGNNSTNLLKNLQFFSLNYERVFQHHFIDGLKTRLISTIGKTGYYRRLMDQNPERLPQPDEIKAFNLMQPHGIIAQYDMRERMTNNCVINNRFNQLVVPYGDLESLKSALSSAKKVEIRVVDDFDPETMSTYPTYRYCNSHISGKNIILLGLSEIGILNSRFDFSKAKSVFSNLEMSTLSVECKEKLGPNLVQNPTQLLASEFIAQLE